MGCASVSLTAEVLTTTCVGNVYLVLIASVHSVFLAAGVQVTSYGPSFASVSYTHLTLPTRLSV